MTHSEPFFAQALASVPDSTRRRVEMSMAISDRLAVMLERRGMNQADLARLMGRSRAEVSRWLGGTHNFTLSTLALISSALDEDVVGKI